MCVGMGAGHHTKCTSKEHLKKMSLVIQTKYMLGEGSILALRPQIENKWKRKDNYFTIGE